MEALGELRQHRILWRMLAVWWARRCQHLWEGGLVENMEVFSCSLSLPCCLCKTTLCHLWPHGQEHLTVARLMLCFPVHQLWKTILIREKGKTILLPLGPGKTPLPISGWEGRRNGNSTSYSKIGFFKNNLPGNNIFHQYFPLFPYPSDVIVDGQKY